MMLSKTNLKKLIRILRFKFSGIRNGIRGAGQSQIRAYPRKQRHEKKSLLVILRGIRLPNPRVVKHLAVKRVLPFFLVTAAVVLVIYSLSFFSLKKVYVVSENDEIFGMDLLSGKLLPLIDVENIGNEILKRNVYAEEVKISKIYPDTLKLFLKPKKPAAVITSDGKALFFTDRTGLIMPVRETDEKIPELVLSGSFSFSFEKPDWRIAKAVTLMETLRGKDIIIDRTHISEKDDDFLLIAKTGEEIRVPMVKAVNMISDSLQIIVTRFRIEGKLIRSIDFSNNKPVVILKNEE